MIRLNKGDRIAVVSLSSGILGEEFCRHQLELGAERLRTLGLEPVFGTHALKGFDYLQAHPEKRAADLIEAFRDSSVQGILCAIGGDDTYRLAPVLFTPEGKAAIRENPKFFMGYSDTTVNHFMLHRLGVPTFYGMSFLTCFADLGEEILPYSLASFERVFTDQPFRYVPSEKWYEERTEFSREELGKNRIAHPETRGFELLRGSAVFEGHLLGGCLESIYDLLVGERYPGEEIVNERYHIVPSNDELYGAILFLETSEERPTPDKLREMLSVFRERGMLDHLAGIWVGKPQDEVYYEEYKDIYREIVPEEIPILYNLPFGHAYPKMLIQYGAWAKTDAVRQEIVIERL